jgi:hypothetical protein
MLNLGVCILLLVLDQVQGFPSNATLFQYLFTIFIKLSATCFGRTTSHVNFRCIYFRLKIVVRPKYVADNLNKIVNYYNNCVRRKPLNLIIKQVML